MKPKTVFVIRYRAGDNGIGNDGPMFLRGKGGMGTGEPFHGYMPTRLKLATLFGTRDEAVMIARGEKMEYGDTLAVHSVRVAPGLEPGRTWKAYVQFTLGPEVWPWYDLIGALADLA